jgi:predicted RNA-binding protein with PIN domain
MRTIILDGYNVILRSPAFRPDESRDLAAARDKLENLLAWSVGSEGEAKFVLVFDGAAVPAGESRRASKSGRVEVRFSKPPQKADDLIRTLVEEWIDRPGGVTVVTSDLEIARHARAQGANVVLSDLFAASLFKERVEERLKDALGSKGSKGGGERATGSPTAEGSDAETKPGNVSKREREEWLKLFEDQRKEEE